MSELVAALDAVDKVAEKFNDKELARKSKDLRGLAAQLEKLFDEYVAACKQNKAASDRLSVKGSAAADELAACLAAKKAEHQEAKEALAIANRIMALTWQTRYARQKVKYDKSEQHLERMEKNTAAMMKEYDRLEAMHPDLQERSQIEGGAGRPKNT